MKKRPPVIRDKDLERLRAVLKVREIQFQAASCVLKRIVTFKSAHLSMFATEVEELQRMALGALCTMEEARRGKKGKVLRQPHRPDQINIRAVQQSIRKRHGVFQGRLEDQDD